LAGPLSFVAWDNYPNLDPHIPYDSSLAADVMRGLKKKNFLIMEQTAGPLGWETFTRNPQPGELRRLCYQQLAHGADGQLWFRWRTCTAGREQYWHGLLGHDGKPGRRYQEAAQVANEYHHLAALLAGTTPLNDIAIVYDYDSLWALQIQGGYPDASYRDAIKNYYRALFRAGAGVDIVRPGDDLRRYRLVIAPHLHVMPDSMANSLNEYVAQGGVLLADCRTGVKDEHNLAHARTLPGLLGGALGIQIDEYESLRLGINDEEEITYKLKTGELFGNGFTVEKYCDWVRPTTAQRIAEYDQQHLRDFAAVTRNKYGKGTGWYVGAIVREEVFYDAVVSRLLADAGIAPLVHLPRGVEAAIRQGNDRRLLFLVNHTNDEQTVGVPQGVQDVLTNAPAGKLVNLGSFGVALLEIPHSSATGR
jgi:beta-galactosidase